MIDVRRWVLSSLLNDECWVVQGDDEYLVDEGDDE